LGGEILFFTQKNAYVNQVTGVDEKEISVNYLGVLVEKAKPLCKIYVNKSIEILTNSINF
jgi:hypothetical protein